MRKLFQALALLAAFVLLIALPQVAADGVRSALTLCGRVILPSLFPFFVCSNLFLLLGFSTRFSARFGGAAAKLLRLPPAAGSAFLLGLLGGYPAGAQAVGVLYTRGELSEPDAERALAVCNQSGPSFIFGVLGGAVFKSAAAGAFFRGSNHFRCTCLPLDREKTAHVRKVCCQAAAARIFCRSFFRVSAPRRDERNSNLHVCYGLFRSLPLFSACRRPLPAVRGTAVVPRYAGTVRRLRGADRLRACASLEAVHCISAFVLRRHKCSGTEPGRRAGVRAERKAAPAVQGASGCAFLHAHAHCRTAAARGKLARCRAFRRGEPGNDRGSVTSSLCGKSSAVSQKVP